MRAPRPFAPAVRPGFVNYGPDTEPAAASLSLCARGHRGFALERGAPGAARRGRTPGGANRGRRRLDGRGEWMGLKRGANDRGLWGLRALFGRLLCIKLLSDGHRLNYFYGSRRLFHASPLFS